MVIVEVGIDDKSIKFRNINIQIHLLYIYIASFFISIQTFYLPVLLLV